MSAVGTPAFARYIGIDYSGAQTPTASLKALRVYMADRSSQPGEVLPPPSPRKYWTRRDIAEEAVQHLSGLLGAEVEVTLEIQAEIPDGAPDNVVRTVTECFQTLRFTSQRFEER